MMDHGMIKSIVRVIEQSDMSELNLVSIEEIPITTDMDDKGREHYIEHLSHTISMMSQKSRLSEAWVAGNILLFTVYDGFLENKYHLKEGGSFRNHYDNIPKDTQFEIIEKDCYRIMKIIRNAIQHNLSGVVFDHGSFSVSYAFRDTDYSLEISENAMKYLYTIVLSIINDKIYDIAPKHRTDGHFMGIISSMYDKVRSGIMHLSDDILGGFIGLFNEVSSYDAYHLRVSDRYTVENPVILSDDDSAVIFKHIEKNGTDNENDKGYRCSTDYVYSEYLLPQELGTIIKKEGRSFAERKSKTTIMFKKMDITDRWRMRG